MMRSLLVLSLVLAAARLPIGAREAETTENDVAQIEADVDRQTAVRDQTRLQTLSRQFSVPAERIEAMRQAGQGWGGVTIRLSMAEQLAKADPQTYPGMEEALAKVEALRAEGKGWGAIAGELGFKLGPVVSSARRARNEWRQAERAGRMDGPARPPRPEKAPRPERPPKPPKGPRR